MKKKSYHEPWKEFSNKYLYILSPSSPSQDDIKIVEKYLKKILKKNKKPNVLILGCTIDYRKLLANYKLFVTMAEINKEMYEANTSVLQDIKRKEKLVTDNWVTMKLKKKFDLILGDFVTTNVSFKLWDKFLKNIRDHLKEKGIFLTRIAFKPKRPTNKKIFDYYKGKKISRKYLSQMWWDVVFHFGYHKKKKVMQNREGFLAIKKASEKYPHMKKWIKSYQEFIPTDKKEWSLHSDSEQKSKIKKYFKVVKIEHARDYRYWEDCPTYILKK